MHAFGAVFVSTAFAWYAFSLHELPLKKKYLEMVVAATRQVHWFRRESDTDHDIGSRRCGTEQKHYWYYERGG